MHTKVQFENVYCSDHLRGVSVYIGIRGNIMIDLRYIWLKRVN